MTKANKPCTVCNGSRIDPGVSFPNDDPCFACDGTGKESVHLQGKAEWAKKFPRITQEQLDGVYEERNRVVAFLSHVFAETAWLSEGDDPEWPIVYMMLPPRVQVSWHIPRKHLFLFKHLSWKPNAWNGHTTEQKYNLMELLGSSMKSRVTITTTYD